MTRNGSARGWRTSSTSGIPGPADPADRLAGFRGTLWCALRRSGGTSGSADPADGGAASAQAYGWAVRRSGLCALSRQSVCPGILRRSPFQAHAATRSILDDALAQADRAGANGALLAETLAAAERGGTVAEKHDERVTIDTTVQLKTATHLTGSKLLHKGIRETRPHGALARPPVPPDRIVHSRLSMVSRPRCRGLDR